MTESAVFLIDSIAISVCIGRNLRLFCPKLAKKSPTLSNAFANHIIHSSPVSYGKFSVYP